MKYIFKNIFVLLLIAGISMGCEDFLTPSVDQEILTEDAVNNVDDLQSLVNGIHDRMASTALYGRNMVATLEVMSDNAFSNGNSGRFVGEAQIDYTASSGRASSLWEQWYSVIANANVVINADIASTPAVDHAKGQAYAARAFAHMNLLMFFGQQFVTGGDPALGIPYITTYAEGNNYPARDPIATVWTNINSDFSTAVSLMDPDIEEDVYLDYWSVRALQTRSYLYQGDMANVITVAEDVIDNSGYDVHPAGTYVAEWNGDSAPSSMFELAYSETDASAFDNLARIYRDTNYGDVEVTEDLYNAYDAADIRLGLFSAVDEDTDDSRPLNYRMVGKWTNENGYDNIAVIRFVEVILNYAEALASEPAGEPAALIELTKITSQRNAPAYATGAIENVWNERRLEIAMEGHRFFDLIRTGRPIPIVDPAQTIADGGVTAGSYRFALPIPQDEIDANSSMVQNDGYGD